MIYSKVDNPKCTLCVHAQIHNESDNISCDIKGTVPADFCCKKFKYDIFKKKIKPRKVLKSKKFNEEDFVV